MTETHRPFVLLSDELILLPSPLSADVVSYRSLFRKLHADAVYCETAFGKYFTARDWTDEEVRDVLLRDAKRGWQGRGMGDLALGILPPETRQQQLHTEANEHHGRTSLLGKPLKNSTQDIRIVQDTEDLARLTATYESVRWIGYVCVRDAVPACPVPGPGEEPLPPWQEMVEVRYGLDASARGGGVATRAQAAVMQWAVEERGVRRFIAETLVGNGRSAKVLERLGFVRGDTSYWGMDGTVEWCKAAV